MSGEVGAMEEIEVVGRSLASAGIGPFLAGPGGEFLWINSALRGATRGLPASGLDGILEGGWGTRGLDPGQAWPSPGAGRTVRLKGDAPRYFTLVTATWEAGARLGIMMECTDRVRSDAARQERETYLTRAAEDSADAFVSLDRDGRIRVWNDG